MTNANDWTEKQIGIKMSEIREKTQEQSKLYFKIHSDIVELIILAQDKMERIGLMEEASFKDLSYKKSGGRMRICYKDVPLIECPEVLRGDLFHQIPGLIDEAQKAFEVRVRSLSLEQLQEVKEYLDKL